LMMTRRSEEKFVTRIAKSILRGQSINALKIFTIGVVEGGPTFTWEGFASTNTDACLGTWTSATYTITYSVDRETNDRDWRLLPTCK
jgi:hypothetical protein